MDMHHTGAGVEGGPRLARHFLRRYRDVMLLRVGQHAVQRAGDDSLVAHGLAFDLFRSRGARTVRRIMRPAISRFLRPRAIARFRPPLWPPLAEIGIVEHAGIAAIDRKIPRAQENPARLPSVGPADRLAR